MAVVQPKAGSGVPGAPTNWQLSPGMEEKVPVIFLDLNRYLITFNNFTATIYVQWRR